MEKKVKDKKFKRTTLGFGDQNDEIRTPDWLMSVLKKRYGKFDFDPCPYVADFDGLTIPWGKHNYANPPYSKLKFWIKKAVIESKKNKFVVMLIPARIHSKYWHENVFPHSSEILLIQHFLTFEDYEKALPVPLAIVTFGIPEDNEVFIEMCTTTMYHRLNFKYFYVTKIK